MTSARIIPTFSLPETLPVFPLTGTVLLPHTRLPLNVFEPRYLAMVQDALADPMRMIGIVQPEVAESPGNPIPPLYRVGCAGRILSFNETEDGRFLISLGGICRFAVEQELDVASPYRRVRINWKPFLGDLDDVEENEIERKDLMDAVQRYFKAHDVAADWDAVQSTPSEILVSSLIMLCPLAASEKQALLETVGLNERAKMLVTLLGMASLPQRDGDGAKRH